MYWCDMGRRKMECLDHVKIGKVGYDRCLDRKRILLAWTYGTGLCILHHGDGSPGVDDDDFLFHGFLLQSIRYYFHS